MDERGSAETFQDAVSSMAHLPDIYQGDERLLDENDDMSIDNDSAIGTPKSSLLYDDAD